jgi:manganese/iron transport system permease protein
MMETLLAPFQFQLMWNALLVGGTIGAVCAVLSCFLVLRGWSLMGDAISHAVLPGIVLCYIAGLPLAAGAFISGLFCAVATGWIKENSRVKEDTVMGVVFTGMFAVGLVLHSWTTSEFHLDHVLYGNILGLPKGRIIETLTISAGVLLVVLAKRRDLLLVCFDRTHARAIGLRVRGLTYLLLVLLSLTIVAAMQAVGVILVIAALITPGATALLLTKRFDRMVAIAVASSVASAWIGVYVSFLADVSTGPCIVLAQTAAFIAALLFAPGTGLARRTRRQPCSDKGERGQMSA